MALFNTHLTYLTIIYCCLTLASNAQKSSSKWGRPTEDEINLKVCFYDSAAPVVVLDESGSVEIGYGSGGVYIKKYIKLKILNEKGLDAANISLPYYAKDNFEVITDAKAQTLNIDNSGKIVIHKVDNNQFFDVDVSENWKEIRFSFPLVDVGSILEYSYTTRSQSYTFLEGWTFQNQYPTLHSTFSARIAEGLKYKLVYQGKSLVDKYGSKGDQNTWELYYLPALKDETHLWNVNNYAERIRFQLVGYMKSDARAGIEHVSLLTTWDAIAQDVLESDIYTDYRNNSRIGSDILNSIQADQITDPFLKASAIYRYILEKISWNGEYRVFPLHPANKLFDSHAGSSADINLMMCSLMKEAGLDAIPMLVSTREHGTILRDCELLTQFNSVIVYLRIDDKQYYVDATDRNRPLVLPPVELVTTSGFCLDKKKPFWADINYPRKSKITSLINLSVGESDTTRFRIEIRYEDYTALENRRILVKEGKDKLVESILGQTYTSAMVDSAGIVNRDSTHIPLLVYISGRTTNLVNRSDQMLYLYPLIIPRINKNPFNSDKRYYPVNFSYTESSNCTLCIKFMDNLQIESLPVKSTWTIPEKLVSYSLNSSETEHSVYITSKFDIAEVVVPPNYYPSLKTLYTNILERINDPVVFRIRK